jgi:hypothetical protein
MWAYSLKVDIHRPMPSNWMPLSAPRPPPWTGAIVSGVSHAGPDDVPISKLKLGPPNRPPKPAHLVNPPPPLPVSAGHDNYANSTDMQALYRWNTHSTCPFIKKIFYHRCLAKWGRESVLIIADSILIKSFQSVQSKKISLFGTIDISEW